MAVKGMTGELYEALRPYVAALPTTSSPINLNTTPAPVLASLSEQAGGNLSGFMDERLHDPLQNTQDAVTRGVLPKAVGNAPPLPVDVHTAYFQLQATVTVGDAQMTLYSTIYRPPGNAAGGASSPRVISMSTGTE